MDVTSKDIAVLLEEVSCSFGNVTAVRNISLDVGRGEVMSLVGHSGCGKSTLLRLIAGLVPATSGRIVLNGREVNGPASFVEPEGRNIGFVFQDYALFPHLTVRENVLFGLDRMPRAEAIVRANEMIGRVGVEHLSHRYPHTLSGGEQQRVALARALAPRPDIVLMDEPFSNLDQGLRDKVRIDTLGLLKSLGTTVIIVTHDPEEALSAGDHVVLMRDGEIVQAGSAYDLYDRPVNAYAAEFFCTFNKLIGTYRDGRVATPLGSFPHDLELQPESSIQVYLRPQGIVLSEEGEIAATVAARVFHGEFELLLLEVDGLDTPLRVKTTKRLATGTENVRFSVLPEHLLLFVP